MIEDIKKQLQDVIDYFDYHNKNLTKEQDCKIEQLKDILEKLKSVNVYFEVARAEVEWAIEDIHNDDLYNYQSIQDHLDKLTIEDINRIAWKVEDYDIWDDIYECARGEVLEEVYTEKENEENE